MALNIVNDERELKEWEIEQVEQFTFAERLSPLVTWVPILASVPPSVGAQ